LVTLTDIDEKTYRVLADLKEGTKTPKYYVSRKKWLKQNGVNVELVDSVLKEKNLYPSSRSFIDEGIAFAKRVLPSAMAGAQGALAGLPEETSKVLKIVKPKVGEFYGNVLESKPYKTASDFKIVPPKEVSAGLLSGFTGDIISPTTTDQGLNMQQPMPPMPSNVPITKPIGEGTLGKTVGEVAGGIGQLSMLPGGLLPRLLASRGIKEIGTTEPDIKRFLEGAPQEVAVALVFGAAQKAGEAFSKNPDAQVATVKALKYLSDKTGIEPSKELATNIFKGITKGAQGITAGGTTLAMGGSGKDAIINSVIAAMLPPKTGKQPSRSDIYKEPPTTKALIGKQPIAELPPAPQVVRGNVPTIEDVTPKGYGSEPQVELPAKIDFYVKPTRNSKEFIPTKGKKIEIPGFENYDFFIHRPISGKGWMISEGKTGMSIGAQGTSQKTVIEDAESILKIKKNTLNETINNQTAKTGISPKYIKSSIQPFAGNEEAIRPIASLNAKTEDIVNKPQIMQTISKIFDVPIRGKGTRWTRGKSEGYYDVSAELIRSKKWGDLEVTAHEVAHHIENKTPIILQGLSSMQEAELKALDYKPEKGRVDEGFAEFIRHYLTTGKAQEVAPEFFNKFQEDLLKNPRLAYQLNNVKPLYETWYKQGALNRMKAQISFRGELEKIPISQRLKDLKDNFISAWIDELTPLQEPIKPAEAVLGRQLRPSENPFKIATYWKGTAGNIARKFVFEKAVDRDGNVIGKSLSEITKPTPKEQLQNAVTYTVALRAANLTKRGIESGFNIDDVNYVLKELKSPQFDNFANELSNWGDNVLTGWLIPSGGLTEKSREIMRDLNPIYVLYQRVLTDTQNLKGASLSGFIQKGKPLKSIKGNQRPIRNPLESMMNQISNLIARSQKTEVMSALTDLANVKGLGRYVIEVPKPTTIVKLSTETVMKGLEKAGIDTSDLTLDEAEPLLEFFTPTGFYMGKENIAPVIKNGELKFYEFSPKLFNAIQGIDPIKLGPVLKYFSPFARFLRLGAVGLKPSFGLVRNPFKDIQTRSINTEGQNALLSIPSSIRGISKDIKAKEGTPAYKFKILGGEMSSQVRTDRQSATTAYDEMLTRNLGKQGKVLHAIKDPINFMRDVFSVTELGPRIAEAESVYYKMKKLHPDWSEHDLLIESGLAGKDVTVNFSKSGYLGKQWNEVTAFFNPNVQGIDKTIRMFKEHPLRTILRGLATIGLLGLTTWYMNKDKDWYKNLDREYKFTNFFIDLGNDTILRLPMAFEVGAIFYSTPIAMLDAEYNKQSKNIGAIMNIFKGFIPSLIPTFLSPMIDVWKNKNWLKIPIESRSEQELPVTERSREYTRELSKVMSKAFDVAGVNLSPIQIDYLMDAFSGELTKIVLPATLKKPKSLRETPVIGDLLVRRPDYPAQQLNDFFDRYKELQQQKNADILKQEDTEEYLKLKSAYKPISSMLRAYKEAQNQKNEQSASRVLARLRIMLNRITNEELN